MKFQFLNKKIRHRRYDYQPMYYDERKERIERKREFYERVEAGEVSQEERRELLRENLRSEFSRSEVRKNTNRTSNLRILLLIGLILALGYFILNGVDEVDTVVKKLW